MAVARRQGQVVQAGVAKSLLLYPGRRCGGMNARASLEKFMMPPEVISRKEPALFICRSICVKAARYENRLWLNT
jgi:hypothetical protein